MNEKTEQQNMQWLYRRRARNYNITVFLYYLLGFRGWSYRKQAVAELNLRSGDRVIDIGCGTGLNFPLLINAIGPEGEIIGIDLSETMLEQAQKRIVNNSWLNVKLVHCDAASYQPPPGFDGAISSFAMKLVPGYDQAIRNAAEALAPGKRFVILDLKVSTRLPSWLTRLGMFLSKPFGVRSGLTDRQPWKSLEKYLPDTSMRERYMGYVYIVTATNDSRNSNKP